jgi:indolepyruvate ferredoxin oxidoreductase
MPVESRPRIVGKRDEHGEALLPAAGALSVTDVAKAIARRLTGSYPLERLAERLDFLEGVKQNAGAAPRIKRLPYFCSGCPHNTSTRVPEGSRAAAGIGCHFMVTWMDRQSETFTQMGGEGANWNGMAPFTDIPHMFVNIGDGTYYHSGLLAIRAAIAAGVNVTYKILYNDAVAMTGGQPVDGPLDVPMITRQMAAEGVERIAVVTDEPEKYGHASSLASGVTVHHRDDLDGVQREMRELSGASVLIYDQTCAAEKRRRRKRGLYPDPPVRAFINEEVCEGCGDCGIVSNCVSIIPNETPFGLKRAIDQSSCNKDYSCLKGFCPSFVTVHGGNLRRRRAVIDNAETSLPEPSLPALDGPYGIVIAGIGGTGVVTLGALLGMAAHLEGKGVTVVDQTGLAQKNGAVVSHLRIARRPDDIHAPRISVGGARLLLGCDMVAAGGRDILDTARHGVTRAVISAHQTMTADFTCNPDARFPGQALRDAIVGACGDASTTFVEATKLAAALLGDTIASNMLLMGFAYQKGVLPVSAAAIERAIELNGATVEFNIDAFRRGRRCAGDPSLVERLVGADDQVSGDLADIIAERAEELSRYQDRAYADRYTRLVDRVRQAESERVPGESGLTEAVARSCFKLLAYKDEYEVARLYADGRFEQRLREEFEGDFTVHFHLAPPLFAKRDPVTGFLRKRRYGPWVMGAFRRLAPFKRLRGTAFDVFGYTSERKLERRLIRDYEAMIGDLLGGLTRDNHRVACELASLPQTIRGFGHVKANSVAQANAREAELLQAFHNRSPTASAAE